MIERVASNDAEAFDEIATLASGRLRQLAHSMLRKYPQVKRWEDTDDVLQSALVRLYRSLKEVKPASSREFYGLAATQIRRSLLDFVRHYQGPRGLGANHHSQGGGKAADDSGGFVARADAKDSAPDEFEGWLAFHESIETLPDAEREVFELIWYGGMSRVDIVSLLDVDQKTVLRRFTRARVRLQSLLSDIELG